MINLHRLKTWPKYFQEVWSGNKTFEVRKNDRNYRVGDLLYLQEYEPKTERYTGREKVVKVTYILSDHDFVKEGYVILGIKGV